MVRDNLNRQKLPQLIYIKEYIYLYTYITKIYS